MAKAYIHIYINGTEFRTYGGNTADVRTMRKKYLNMTEEDFLNKHPFFTNNVQSYGYNLDVSEVYIKR